MTQIKVVGFDPGKTTGFAEMNGDSEDRFGSGNWDVKLKEFGLLDAYKAGLEFVEEGSSVFLPASAEQWWQECALAGISFAMYAYGLEADLVVIEDYILRPSAAAEGIGGRDAIIPVAITGSLVNMHMQMCATPVMFSSPSAKAVMDNGKLKRWFGEDVGKGKPHGMDALRHCCLGIRKMRTVINWNQ